MLKTEDRERLHRMLDDFADWHDQYGAQASNKGWTLAILDTVPPRAIQVVGVKEKTSPMFLDQTEGRDKPGGNDPVFQRVKRSAEALEGAGVATLALLDKYGMSDAPEIRRANIRT